VLEGGAIHVDGEGTLLATEECLLNPNRNPQLDTGQLKILLHEYLGINRVIWLGKGVIDDETDGHVDNLCCFARPGEVVLTWTDDKRDPQYRVSKDAYERLMDSRDAQDRQLKVHKLQQPGPLAANARGSSRRRCNRGRLRCAAPASGSQARTSISTSRTPPS
jgi:agmatine deiminase